MTKPKTYLLIKLFSLLLILAWVLESHPASAIFHSIAAASATKTRQPGALNTTRQDKFQRALAETLGQAAASSDAGAFVIEAANGQITCRTANVEETRVMQRRLSEDRLHVITEGRRLEQLEAQSGLKIILRGTPQLEQFPTAKAAFIRAAVHWESVIRNPITMVIDVDFGPTRFGVPYPARTLGSTFGQAISIPNGYAQFRTALLAHASNAQETAIYNALPATQISTELGATLEVEGPSALFRALGLISAVADPDGERLQLGPPPSIGFNSAMQFDFDPSDGIAAGAVDFDAVVTHEIGHALGFTSAVGDREIHPNNKLKTTAWDLFRFRPGVTNATFTSALRVLTSGGEQIYFNGQTALPVSTGRPDTTGGDGRQCSHWKDDELTGNQPIGIMDPTLPTGHRQEMTENDLKMLDLLGYQIGPSQDPNESQVELKIDDGASETGGIGDGLTVVNRLTPPRYPATLRKLRIMFPTLQNHPDPTGKPVTIWIFTDPNGIGHPPPVIVPLTRINMTVPGTSLNSFYEITIPNGPTINSGDFYVGYQAPTPAQGVGFVFDTSGAAQNRAFFQEDPTGFHPLAPELGVAAASAMVRAVVELGQAQPTEDVKALTSGTAQNGAIAAPITNGQSVLGTTQYTIQVPTGATQLKLDLHGNQDVDLHVRFGQRVAVQNNQIVADFTSESSGGDEQITITPASTPALRAGTYYIGVRNFGPSAATFTLTATVSSGGGPGNRIVRVGAASGAPGGTVKVPIELVAQGDENALGLSLTFDANVLRNPQVALGADANGAQFNTNTNQVNLGRLGVALALPSGQHFNAGTRQVVTVNFEIAGGITNSSTPIGFGDQPVAREISNINAQALTATYTGGEVSLATGIEADVTPRQNSDGKVTITDWVQVGRFVAGLDLAVVSEFLRADCAPRETRGDGRLTITDWVQAGRYTAGLDTIPSAGGPNLTTALGLVKSREANKRDLKLEVNDIAMERQMRLLGGSLQNGQQSAVIVQLEAQGNENAFGFSVTFDPAQLRFVTAAVGSGASGATLNVNTYQAANGSVGLAIALPAGQTLTQGARQIVVINFAVMGSEAKTAVGFSDQPIMREISDADARVLPVAFFGASVTLVRSVATVSAASFTGEALASEELVSAFGEGLATQVAVAGLPLPTQLAGTTVKVTDSTGTEQFAQLLFVAPSQINYQIPANLATGAATVTITSSNGTVSLGMINLAPVAPGLFAVGSGGQGLAAAVALRVRADGSQSYEPIAEYDAARQQTVAVPLDLGPANEQVYLMFFGTGFRHHSALPSSVLVELDGVEAEVLYAGPQGPLVGLDQLNVRLLRSLAGRGEINVVLTVDGQTANPVKLQIK